MAKKPMACRFRLQGRLLLLCIGTALPIFTVFVLSLFEQVHLLKEQSETIDRVRALSLASTLDIWGNKQILEAKSIARHLANSNPELTRTIIAAAIIEHPEWSSIYQVFPDGKINFYLPGKAISSKAILNTKDRDTLAKLSRGQRTICLKSFFGDKMVLLIVNSTGKNSFLVIEIEPKTLLKLLAESKRLTASGVNKERDFTDLILADSTRQVLVHSSADKSFVTQAIGQDPLPVGVILSLPSLNKNICQTEVVSADKKRTYLIATVPSLALFLIAGPRHNLDQSVIAWLTNTLFLTAIVIFASIYLAFWATRNFSLQIRSLVKEMLAFGRGDLSKRIEVKSNDELGKLGKAFNQVASKFQREHEHRRMEETISQAIRQSLDLERVLVSTVSELGKALGASRCCLALIDQTKANGNGKLKQADQELIFDYVWFDQDKGGTALINHSLHINENSILSMILEQGSILSLDVLDEDGPTPLFDQGKQAPEDWRSIRSLIACPITSAEGTIGLILIQQCDRLRSWTDKEIELVESITRQLTIAMQHAHLYYYTRTMAEQEMLINHIVRSVRSSLDLDTILNTVTRELCLAIKADRCQILQPDISGPLVVSHEFFTQNLSPTKGLNLYSQPIDFSPLDTEEVFSRGSFLLGIDLEKVSLRSSQPINENGVDSQPYDPWLIAVINNSETDARASAFKYFLQNCQSTSLIAAPLLSENRIIGLLVVHQCDAPRTWRTGEVQLVAALADQLAIAVTQAHLFAQVKYQAITDGLTGLYNHIYFQNRLTEELRLASRKGLPCSLLMLDLDRLKQINDTYGHPVGDAAIRQVATILKTVLRSGDTAARYGGEEFAVILPETSLLEGALIADRLCTKIAEVTVPGLGQITASVGVASYPRQGKDTTELIAKADQALYEAKKAGRNQIWISESMASSDEAVPTATNVPEFRVTRRLALANSKKAEEVKNVQQQQS